MTFDKLKEELLLSLRSFFQAAKIDVKERRGIVLEMRAYLDEATFIEVYANAVTGKRSFSLILKGERVTGYDNYRFWHYHPPDNPDDHIPCSEPTIYSNLSSFKDVLVRRTRD